MLNFPFNIEVRSDSAVITGEATDGSAYRKTVSLESLCSMFAEASACKETVVPIGCRCVVETGSYVYYVFTSPEFVGNYHVVFDSQHVKYLPKNWEYNINDSPFTDFNQKNLNAQASSIRTFSVPYPATCIIAKMIKSSSEKYRLDTMYAYALASEVGPVKDLTLYRWPYSNVYNSSKVCTGDIATEYKCIESIGSIPTTFFNSVCNNDLYYPNECLSLQAKENLARYDTIWGLLGSIHGKKTFPVSWLNKSNLTLGEWLEYQKVNN